MKANTVSPRVQAAFFDGGQVFAVNGLVGEVREVDLAVIHGGIQE